jgi:hypothetical protein
VRKGDPAKVVAPGHFFTHPAEVPGCLEGQRASEPLRRCPPFRTGMEQPSPVQRISVHQVLKTQDIDPMFPRCPQELSVDER